MSLIKKLALGTVQFGMHYGAFNDQGRVSSDQVETILSLATASGITLLDSARLYGDSEAVLGSLKASRSFEIVTKCPSLEGVSDPDAEISVQFEKSMAALNRQTIKGYLLHHVEDLQSEQARKIWGAFERLKASGRVTKIGVSGYNAYQMADLCKQFPIDLVQLPANVLSEWLYDEKLAAFYESQSVELHVRSAFLQGFLLSQPDTLPDKFEKWQGVLSEFLKRSSNLGLTPIAAALGVLSDHPAVDKIVLGVDNAMQLEQILQAVEGIKAIDRSEFSDLVVTDPQLVDPRIWGN